MVKPVSFEEMEAFRKKDLERFTRQMVFFSGGTREDAEDVYAESRFRALRGFVNFKLGDDPLKVFWSWRCRIIINTWNDELRHRRCLLVVSLDNRIDLNIGGLDLPDPDVDIEGQVSSKDERVRFWKNVESLLSDHKPAFWQCVKLRFVYGLEYEEIASVLDCPSGTVKSRLCRAIKFLRSAAISI